MHPFFETYFVLQEPTYSSIYAMGQGMLLAIGRIIFGHWWAGVLLSTVAFSALCYWMLRAWITPGWALIGGLLAVMQFGPLNQWTNGYWGGTLSAIDLCGGPSVSRFGLPGRMMIRPKSVAREASWA